MSGKTIEVLNTDAEGRLISPTAFITQAARPRISSTPPLSPAPSSLPSQRHVGVFGSDQPFTDKLLASSKPSAKKCGRCPSTTTSSEFIKGKSRHPEHRSRKGAPSRAMFIKEFTATRPGFTWTSPHRLERRRQTLARQRPYA